VSKVYIQGPHPPSLTLLDLRRFGMRLGGRLVGIIGFVGRGRRTELLWLLFTLNIYSVWIIIKLKNDGQERLGLTAAWVWLG
jgi:hypothetical protein